LGYKVKKIWNWGWFLRGLEAFIERWSNNYKKARREKKKLQTSPIIFALRILKVTEETPSGLVPEPPLCHITTQ
jgi:hypothetical protein